MTTYLDQVFDLTLLMEMIDEGMVKQTEHPEIGRLKILNYTPAAQYSKTWNEVTRQCRGLIYDSLTMEVLARPFEKFFNVGEHESLPNEPFRVFEKMDGSLGILYPTGTGWAIATRGSFASEQAIWATHLLRTRYPDFAPDHGYTYLFEIIYPDNRIVVDYDGMEDLVLLDVVEIKTGKQAVDREWFAWSGPWVDEHEYDSLSEMVALERPNHEGFVLVYQSGLRVKVKHEEYVAMHGIVTNTSSRTIWELLSTGKGLDDILAFVPDEFADWVRSVAADLLQEFGDTFFHAHELFRTVTQTLPSGDRKAFAQAVQPFSNKALLFRILDDRPIADIIWKMIKPERTLPFRVDA